MYLETIVFNYCPTLSPHSKYNIIPFTYYVPPHIYGTLSTNV